MPRDWILATVFLVSGGVAAAGTVGPLDSCRQVSELHQAVRDCLDRRLQAAEAEMEKVAMSVHASMADLDRVTGRPEIVAEFENSERAFREYLERHCAWVGAAASDAGAAIVLSDCMIRLTEQHTAELQSQLPKGKTAALAASTSPLQKASRAGGIPGGEWRLTYMEHQGKSLPLPPEPRATLSFDKNGMAAGRSFVNRYFGTASVTEHGHLSWNGALGSTRMGGPPGLMEAEDHYLKALARVSRWRIEADTLTLDSGDTDVLLRYSR